MTVFNAGIPLSSKTNPANGDAEDWLVAGLETVRLKRNQQVYEQGEPVAAFYIVRMGLLGLYRNISSNKRILACKISDGEPIGIAHMMKEEPYPGSLVPIKETVAYRGTREYLSRFQKEDPEWLNRLLLYEIQIQDRVFQTIGDLVGKELNQRIARELLELSEHLGRETPEGIQLVIKLTRKQISEMIGCAQESVIRIVSSWEKKGWIESDKKYITLKEPDRLRALIEGSDKVTTS